MTKNVLIGVAWPYVNGELHIGHLAGYLMPADICARYNRLVGNNVLMVSGSDCFGTPITVEADKRNITPAEVVNEYHAYDLDLFTNKLKLTYDLYTLTNNPTHIKIAQDFFVRFIEEDLLYIDVNDQYYSPTQNKFLPDRYVVGECPYCGFKDCRSDQCDNCGKLLVQGELVNPRSNLTGDAVVIKQSEHYFINWPKLQKKLEEYVGEKSCLWKEWVAAECKGWLAEGVKARAITRDLDWGVPIPVDRLPQDKIVKGYEHKRIYVWFDAVIGYYSASVLWAEQNNKEWKPFWYDSSAKEQGQILKHYYFMGKDNLVFHTLFWPGQLMTFDKDLHLPDVVSINMFLNYDGKQFSKSRGHTIKIKDMVEKFGNDALRFYLTLIMPEVRDSSFNWNDFKEKNNGILVANLGNFINRVLSLSKTLEIKNNFSLSESTANAINNAFTSCISHLANCEFRYYLDSLLELSSYGNSLIDQQKVWELKKTDPEKFSAVMHELLTIVVALGKLMRPLLFEASDKLEALTGVPMTEIWPQEEFSTELVSLVGKAKISSEITPLFVKLEGEVGL